MRAITSSFAFIAALILAPVLLSGSAHAQDYYETEATHAVIMDFETGQVLFAKDAETPMAPSSMSKMMTVLMVLEAIDAGTLSMDDELPVSEYAWRTGGAASGSSTMFLELHSRARVDDLLRGVIIQSGGDACIVLAEALSGSEAAFADAMTARAHELGLMSAQFANSTGWPDPNHYISALDLARLARILIRDHPEYYGIWAEREFTYNGIRQYNRNPLLGNFAGADGLKTGHTEAAGYGLAATAERDGQRRIIVFNGMESNRARTSEAERMMRAAMSDFAVYDLFEAGAAVDERATVFMGEADTVGLQVGDAVQVALQRRARRNMTVSVVYDGPLMAPIAAGQEIGHLVVEAPGYEPQNFPLYAAEDVARKGVLGRIGAALAHMIRGGN
ncbi:D-alanyl-D-alanine carboxypeptidase family protein [Maricaulis salignorans]|uniref:serine-type D-Ala-D-Ala carboxypeptidase n=1 Tax=Maricaulis salignorans TaxID=144026 RepID=A0A1G9P0B3_9PROT|nr:D-alanyl-D-alanine carboxypeptidase family protein [Maricaulis salignorans]SDL92248.1 D-alanyl-D-alanine carboxypeptidase (penicillin-binding protein 5/6) [Maricaulis salignorans]